MLNSVEMSISGGDSQFKLSFLNYFKFLNKTSKCAFTLAEVLITIGIIGVVSALTLPVLTEKFQDKVLEVQTLKAENLISNGYNMIQIKNEYDMTDFFNCGG